MPLGTVADFGLEDVEGSGFQAAFSAACNVGSGLFSTPCSLHVVPLPADGVFGRAESAGCFFHFFGGGLLFFLSFLLILGRGAREGRQVRTLERPLGAMLLARLLQSVLVVRAACFRCALSWLSNVGRWVSHSCLLCHARGVLRRS